MRKQPLQARAQASCDAILEASAQILVKVGLPALNTNLIAERAGVSVGTLYQYFPGKEAIVAELINQMRHEMLEDLTAASQSSLGKPLETVVRVFISASLLHHRRNPDLAKALEQAESVLPLQDRTQALKTKIHALVTQTLAQFGIQQPEIAARDLAALVSALAEQSIHAGETDFVSLADRCVRAAFGYLGIPPQSPNLA